MSPSLEKREITSTSQVSGTSLDFWTYQEPKISSSKEGKNACIFLLQQNCWDLTTMKFKAIFDIEKYIKSPKHW